MHDTTTTNKCYQPRRHTCLSLFVDCNRPLIKKLNNAAVSGSSLNMETEFCSVSLDIIGRAVFNYNFSSVETESPIVKAVYRALQEAEHRSTSFIPYWNIPFARHFMKNLKDSRKPKTTESIKVILKRINK